MKTDYQTFVENPRLAGIDPVWQASLREATADGQVVPFHISSGSDGWEEPDDPDADEDDDFDEDDDDEEDEDTEAKAKISRAIRDTGPKGKKAKSPSRDAGWAGRFNDVRAARNAWREERRAGDHQLGRARDETTAVEGAFSQPSPKQGGFGDEAA